MVDTDSPSLLPDIRLQRMPDARLTDNPCGGGVLSHGRKGNSPHLPGQSGQVLAFIK